jgi:hypothetical protein
MKHRNKVIAVTEVACLLSGAKTGVDSLSARPACPCADEKGPQNQRLALLEMESLGGARSLARSSVSLRPLK